MGNTRLPIIPEPATDAEYGPDDFAESTKSVERTRERLLKDPAVAAVHDDLLARIEERIASKQATLAEVRRAVGFTQNQIAEMLGMTQGDVSKLERRDNLHLMTLARFIEATGGHLRIVATYGPTEVDLQVGDLLSTE